MYRVGIVGLGRKASMIDDEADVRWLTNYDVNPSTHTSSYLANRQTKIVAVCSRTMESCQRWKERWKQEDVRCYTDYQEMLAKEELDIVSICTHADLHGEITLAATQVVVGLTQLKAPKVRSSRLWAALTPTKAGYYKPTA